MPQNSYATRKQTFSYFNESLRHAKPRKLKWRLCFRSFSFLILIAIHSGGRAADLWPPPAQPGALSSQVDPFIGTGGISFLCGNNFPGAMAPLGMVRLSPDTISPRGAKASNMSGYYYGDQQLLGFSHTRLVGTGAIDGGNCSVLPSVANLTDAELREGVSYRFSHDQEQAFPGYYAVMLPEPKILAELTASTRVGVHRYTFPAGQTPYLRINVSSALGKGRCSEASVRWLPDRMEVEGSARTFGAFSSRYGGSKIHFVARCNRAVTKQLLWDGQQLLPEPLQTDGESVGIQLQFASSEQPVSIELKMGISFVSIQNARQNLEAEAGQADFDQVLRLTGQSWETHLAKGRVAGGNDQQQTIYYTALYRALNMPTTFSDVDGSYLGFDKQVHQADGFNYYTDMSLWDTFRTTHPLYTLLYQQQQRDMVVSLVQMSRHGGYLPRWPSGSGYTNSMFGTPADLVIAETYLKNIRDFDVHAAYAAILRTADQPTPPGARFSGREGIQAYLQYGYCPSDLMGESVARTLEYCYADYAIARLAEALGKSADARRFDQRALAYRQLWNPQTQFFQARDSQGEFQADFRPLMLTYTDLAGKFTKAYVEGSAWQWRWAVPHDASGLIELFSSRDQFVSQLEEFFTRSPTQVGAVPNAYYWQGNQPDLFAAYLFNAAGRPDLTQKWVRWVLEHKYGVGPNGLDGNDDGGTLSAWYVLSSLGLYPIAGTDRYELSSPLWSRADLSVGSRPLEIIVDRDSPDAMYIRKVTLNGQTISGTQLRHSQIAGGGQLRFELSATPQVVQSNK
ncbi:MAG: GH92 family glycosyl hydrolase [Pirellulaceae bacterium]|nr:GH92 family glycosyl hydrolase [Pirellulaceae bacterium]